jgi:hypothetical protein
LDLIEIPRYVRHHTNRVERVTAVAILKVINLSATLLGCASLEGSTPQARHIAYPKGDREIITNDVRARLGYLLASRWLVLIFVSL